MKKALPSSRVLAHRDFGSAQQKLVSCFKVVGPAFFPKMTESLADVLSVRWVLVSALHPSDRSKAKTISVWDNGPSDNFEYSLADTPCANVLSNTICAYPNGVTNLFPLDQMLVDMGAECYVGVPLRATSGEVLGLLAVVHDKPLEQISTVTELVEVFAGRAAAELERLATASLNERLGQIVEASVSEVYVFDANTYKFVMVNRGARENLGYQLEELRQLTPWDLKPEYSQEQFMQMLEPLRAGNIPHLLFETLHQRKDNSLYQVAVQLQYIHGPDGVFYASITDITERKRAEVERSRLAAIVASSSEAIVSKTLDSVVTSWNDAATRMFGYSAAEMVGGSIRCIIPPDRQQEEDEIIARIRVGDLVGNYETVRRCKDGSFIEVSVTVSPIYDEAGRIIGASNMAHDITERKRSDAERARLAAIVSSSTDAIISITVDGIVTSWNQAAERIFGFTAAEMISSSVQRIIPDDRLPEENAYMALIRRGKHVTSFETKRQRADGSFIDVSLTISPITDETGRVVGASRIVRDITDRKCAEEHERLLMHEVNHRAKNILALVQSIARQTAAAKPQDFLERFGQRVRALAANQDVLVKNGWRNVAIDELARAQLGHFGDLIGDRIVLSGPSFEINAAAAQAIGLALHELATNAAKYGALSNDMGVVSVSWKIVNNESEPRFAIAWAESGGPLVEKPNKHGFGSNVIDKLTRMSLNGKVEIDYAPHGLTWILTCPVDKIADVKARKKTREAAPPPTADFTSGSGPAARRRILVVEDEAIVALEIATALEEVGFVVLGPATSVTHARSLLGAGNCDGAVLDVNLGEETAEPIALDLARAGTPFLTVSAYARDQLPSAFRRSPLVSKPIRPDRLLSELERILATSRQLN